MNQYTTRFTQFLDISVYLCGFDPAELSGTGMAQRYYEVLLLNSDPEDVRLFFEAVDRILTNNRQQKRIDAGIANELMSVDAYRGLARRIVLLWYTGAWDAGPISPEAYKQGLMWAAAETHPAGAKQPGFGSWSSKPIQV